MFYLIEKYVYFISKILYTYVYICTLKMHYLGLLGLMHQLPRVVKKRSIHWLGHVRQLGAQILDPAHAPGISGLRERGANSAC